MKYVKYYRVQGGDGFSKSREMLNVTASKSIDLDPRKKIYIGSEEHNKNFIKLRLKEKWKKYAGIDTNKANVNVVIMYFPKFFSDLLKQCAISEYIATGRDTEAPPHTVDITKGEAYALYGFWNLLMKACNIYAKNNSISSEQDIENLYNSDVDISQFNVINVEMLENSLNHICYQSKIGKKQIQMIINESRRINEELEKLKKGKDIR